MKKMILFFLILFTLSGCGKKVQIETLTCTYEGTKENNKFNNSASISIKDGEVIESVLTSKYEDENAANNVCNIYKLSEDAEVSCDGKVITIKGFHKTINDNDKITKDDISKYFDEQGYKCN